jgi:AmmeMemoRadiSam system protein B/AmmeMemoRadiSam system protein A
MKPIVFFVGLGMLFFCAGLDSFGAVREPAVAGLFYPRDAAELRQTVQQHLENVTDLPKIDGRIIALIVPHAGIVYSGQIAAYSYKLLEHSNIKKVILCGPSHRYPFRGISVYGPDVTWRTPLGDVPCDDVLCKQMIDHNKMISVLSAAHQQEHCLEVQLPYLQTVLKEFTLVPALMGYPDHETTKTLAEALAAITFDDATVMIASTDWQHFMSASEGWKYDSVGLECLKNLDPDNLEKQLAQGKTQMCGGGAATAVIKAALAKGADRVKILKYGDSGDVTGKKDSVVSYVAAVLYQSSTASKTSGAKEVDKASSTMTLSDAEKQKLLQIARGSIETYLKTGQTPAYADVPEKLKQPGAAFVTLTEGGQLRGCIGRTAAIDPISETVAYCAVQAAVADPRFQPVTAAEMSKIHIEISVLTPLQRIKSLDEITVGRDGLMIVDGSYHGLLLPQVATDYGWDRTTFLEQTCRKAGLPGNAYQSRTAEIYRFQALIFGE